MRAIKGLTVLAVLATLAWGGYWYAGSRALDRAIATAFTQIPEVAVDSYQIRGFPNRFDVSFEAPRLETPGLGWRAPFLQLFALTYKPYHLVAVFAPDQILTAGGQEVLVHAEDLRASLVMEPALDLPVDRVTLVGETLDIQWQAETHALDSVRLASRRVSPLVHEVALAAEGLFPDPALMDRIDPQALWPRRLERLRGEIEIETDRPIDRHLGAGPAPRLTRVTLTGFHATWPGTDLALEGRLTPGADGMLSGEVTLRVTGWQALVSELRQAGILDAGTEALLTGTLGAMAQTDGEALDVPLAVVEGDVRLGPLLLGTLPRLRL